MRGETWPPDIVEGDPMKKSLRIIPMKSFYEIANQFPDGYFAIYSPQMTILILDKNKKHRGSIFLKEEILIPQIEKG